MKDDKNQDKLQSIKPGINFGVDPVKTPVLYADAIRINSNPNGFVLDVAQSVGGTNQAVVVTRIGLSREHAKKLAEALAYQISRQGIQGTGKAKIVN